MSVIEGPIALEAALHQRFGLEQFRPGQREVIEHVLQKRDVLCVMPTGGGKSLCYQLPALLLPGVTLVVSPLIALMKDQTDALRERGVRATLINSTLDPAEQRARMIEIEAGRYDLVYVAPERFRSHRFVEMMARVRPALLAVDEAHCISEWGHDFRPDYARLGQARRQLGFPPCIALTATATDVVRRDIADQLDLQDPAVFVTGFDRPNLGYAVIEARRDGDKLSALAEALDQNPGAAIVYASSRARCETVGHYLERELRRDAVVYHAGLPREERAAAQERFMRGDAQIVVATNAFGMGVDKPDIRSVIHFNIPGTLEAYYQEAGRAGRDGLPSHCLLLFAPGDRFLQELFIENEYPPANTVYQIYNYLRSLDADPIEQTQLEIKEAAAIDLNEQAVGTALRILEGAGAIERFQPRENMAIVRINAEPDEPSFVERLHPQANIQRVVLTGIEGLVNRRFNEPVYFLPDEFANALGIDRPALARALKALTSELPIDYVPPFRGTALRVTDRKKPPSALGIDFAALEKRKKREYDKLDRMIRYAQTRQCRRSYLLGYFGDSSADRIHCGHCDNCGPAPGGASATDARPIATPGGREVVLKVLSGVARARGRFGKLSVAQMLTGSGAEKMDRSGLKRLSTYGILNSFKQQEVSQVLDALIEAGLVASLERDRFPVVNLTERGWEWVRGQGESELRLGIPDPLYGKVCNGGLERLAPRSNRVEPGQPEPLPQPEVRQADADGLEQRLRELRTAWAREANVPAYCVFPNTVLDELARTRPQTPHALAAIKGLGPAKIERYGKALLEAIGARAVSFSPSGGSWEGEAPAEPPDSAPSRAGSAGTSPSRGEPNGPANGTSSGVQPAPGPAPRPAANGYVSTEEWTWRLLDRGFTLDECAAIRGLDQAAVIRHATWMARQGRAIDPRSFLSPDVIDAWRRWQAEHGEQPPPPDLGATPGLWPLFLACARPAAPLG